MLNFSFRFNGLIEAAITQEQEKCWKIPSKSRNGVAYLVTIADQCDCSDEINSHCVRCGVCAYQVHCTCPDGYKAGVSCLHAHAVATFAVGASTMLRPPRHPLGTGSCSISSSTNKDGNICAQQDAGSEQCALELEPDYGSSSSTVAHPPENICSQDFTKEEYQVNEGIQARMSEISRSLLKSNRGHVLKEWNNILHDAMQKLPRDVIESKAFPRRSILQTTGAGPKPSRIQPQYKSRSKLEYEKRKKRQYIDGSDSEVERQRILSIDRKQLQTCFVCGRRNPDEDFENDVYWVSCSNNTVCKAWAHMICCTGVGSQCSICKHGQWQLEEV
ncbi:hypothetical protein ANCCAN_00984 [Ancylostoma caninum]|uniref:SWIM-type domain-containing protein n=1 Tax=Ancylostoma caninum TaxID=29170 RepID=A0A368HCE7_ANCCA|nr:hypothetical protein ANCCAN_00984 [Ancylostoma caninum]